MAPGGKNMLEQPRNLEPCGSSNKSMADAQVTPLQAVNALEELQLPHARLLYMIAHMFKLGLIGEAQRMELKCK